MERSRKGSADRLLSPSCCSGLFHRLSPYQPESFFEHRRSFRRFEERPKDVMHDGPVGGMVGLKLLKGGRSTRPRVAHADRATFEFILSVRQRVRLQVVDHLQFMLDIPEKLIGAGEAALLFR